MFCMSALKQSRHGACPMLSFFSVAFPKYPCPFGFGYVLHMYYKCYMTTIYTHIYYNISFNFVNSFLLFFLKFFLFLTVLLDFLNNMYYNYKKYDI